MLAAGRGSIVNVGSMSGFIVNRPQPQSYYNASKAAVHQLTKSLAADWAGRGVRVTAVAPTYIATPLHAFADKDGEMYRRWIDGPPMERLGEPEEVDIGPASCRARVGPYVYIWVVASQLKNN